MWSMLEILEQFLALREARDVSPYLKTTNPVMNKRNRGFWLLMVRFTKQQQ